MGATLVNIEQLGFISADYYLDSTKHQGKTVSVLASQGIRSAELMENN
jgi:hypothetical protein